MLDIGRRTPMIHPEQYFIPAFPWSVDVAQVLPKGLREFLYTHINMNITPGFIKSPSFLKLERDLGDNAYKYTVLLGMYCQQQRTTELEFKDILDFELIIGATEGGNHILGSFLKYELIEESSADTYYIKYFVETNGQLLSLWKNGEMRAKKSKAKKEQPADVVDYAELDRKWAEANAKIERKLAHG